MPQTLGPELWFDTPDFILRSLVPGDENDSWANWLADPTLAANLNAAPRAGTMDQLRAYIAKFNRIDRHALGIFAREDGEMVGIRTIEIDPARRAFNVHVLVGEKSIWGQGAKEQTSIALINWAFETRDLIWCEASVLASNRKMLRHLDETGWVIWGKGITTAAVTGKAIDVVKLRRHRDVWRKDPRSSFITGDPPQTGVKPP
ncbi:MAG: GNAT family N-acetyltransferase [Micropepsaceae bacterium]